MPTVGTRTNAGVYAEVKSGAAKIRRNSIAMSVGVTAGRT